jgi:hypothetical protein
MLIVKLPAVFLLAAMASGCRSGASRPPASSGLENSSGSVIEAFRQFERTPVIESMSRQRERLASSKRTGWICISGCRVRGGFDGKNLERTEILDPWYCCLINDDAGSFLLTNVGPAKILHGHLIIRSNGAADSERSVTQRIRAIIERVSVGTLRNQPTESWDGADLVRIAWKRAGAMGQFSAVNSSAGMYDGDPGGPKTELQQLALDIYAVQREMRDQWSYQNADTK